MAVPWPSVKTFMEEAEMLDSYRVSHPDEVTSPGHTWTTLPATDYAEVLDRIDFVLFHGGVEVLDSSIVGEKSTLSDIGFENYPSDHRSVVSTFRIKR